MKVVARRQQGFAHEVEIEGGHTVLVDEPAEIGGTGTGPSPTRLLAASLASCTAVTMEMYAARKGWELGDVEVEVDTEYEGFVPTSFAVVLRVSPQLSEEQRQRLATIAARCPVRRALVGDAKVTVTERIEAL